MPRITENLVANLAASPAERLIAFVDQSGVRKVSRETAIAAAKVDPIGYTLVVRGGVVRKMIAHARPEPQFEPCWRNTGAAAYPPWPGFFERLQTS